ncbi:MAG: DEAD/DEAH box helicase family protein, partial [Lacunisphaera sp.]
MSSSLRQQRADHLRRQLADLSAEILRTEDELASLECNGRLVLDEKPLPPKIPQTPAEKVALFLDLFGTRRSVYPKRWENGKTGKGGYSPACDNDSFLNRQNGICQKPKVKCSECCHQRFRQLDEHAIESHLRGEQTLGVYAIGADDTCRFLAADFDGDGWWNDVLAYREAAERVGLTVAIERSRSGNGAHGWIFFAEPVPAGVARRLGAILVAKASALRPTLSLGAYDRLFPNQDALPVGGFGNLIALPLAKAPRQNGNTLFVDQHMATFDDQWSYLAGLPRLNRESLERVLARIAPVAPGLPPSRIGAGLDHGDDFALQSDAMVLDLSQPYIRGGMIAADVTVRLDAQIHVPRSLPTPVLAALKRLATFPNPVFHEKLRLRFATYDTPRFLFAGEWHANRLVLPRGVLDRSLALLEMAGATVVVQDGRDIGKRVPWKFHGELREDQEAAVRKILAEDQGVLCAPPGAGKTVIGCALIARARTSALVLVHRAVLADQWRETARQFLGLKRKEIGIWRGQTHRLTRRFDIAMLPSLARVEDLASVLAGYGVVIIDECHHVPAASFEAVLKACPSRRVYGLTATPKRKDRLEKLLFTQCGPIRHTLLDTQPDEMRTVKVRRTTVSLPANVGQRPPIHIVWEALVQDQGRIAVIVSDLLSCVASGRSPLVLADRKVYLDRLQQAFTAQASHVICHRLEAQLGKRARSEILRQIDEHYTAGTPFVLFATASLVGEGFDLPRLDTLVLAMPLSWKGRLVQYAGRLHRIHDAKGTPLIYDYVDGNYALTNAMFRRRLVGYRELNYTIEMPPGDAPAWFDLAGPTGAAGHATS